ncbi:hypothetical protein N9242_04135 [Vicingaceae bacterium]|nr:hypothetical protein [Vicingaceae bacterium]
MKKIQLILILAGAFATTMQSCSKDEVKGCTDTEACNFNEDAQLDNGSCTYATEWYKDLDGDGLGNPYSSITDCNQPHGYVKGLCNPRTFYQDLDGDGLGNPAITRIECDTAIQAALGYVTNADDLIDVLPDSIQRAVITYIGATWDSTSGNFGLPALSYIQTNYPNAVLLNVQGNVNLGDSGITGYILADDFGPEFGNEFETYSASTTMPHVYMGSANYPMYNQQLTNSTPANNLMIDNTIGAINSSILDVKVIANANRVGDSVFVNTAVEFIDASAEHFIGVYLLEDNVLGLQNYLPLAPNQATFNNVVRSAGDLSNPLGTSSMGPSFLAGQRVEGSYGIKISTAGAAINPSNLKVAVVVYKTDAADGFSNAILIDVD